MPGKKLKQFPSLKSDEEAEDFVANCDLTEYDLSGGRRVHFELQKKNSVLNMRVPAELAAGIKAKAKARGIPYTRYIRALLEADLRSPA